MQTPSPKPIEAAQPLDQFLGSARLQFIVKKARLLGEINRILAAHLEPALAERCRAANWEHGYLTLEVDSAAWATRLGFLIPQLIQDLNNYPLLAILKNIQCKIRPQAPTLTPINQQPQLSTTTCQLIKNTAKTIQDPKLKQALLKLTEV